jgi:hypothetical protein
MDGRSVDPEAQNAAEPGFQTIGAFSLVRAGTVHGIRTHMVVEITATGFRRSIEGA